MALSNAAVDCRSPSTRRVASRQSILYITRRCSSISAPRNLSAAVSPTVSTRPARPAGGRVVGSTFTTVDDLYTARRVRNPFDGHLAHLRASCAQRISELAVSACRIMGQSGPAICSVCKILENTCMTSHQPDLVSSFFCKSVERINLTVRSAPR